MTKSRFDMKIFFCVLIPLCAFLSCAHKEPEFNYPISVQIHKLHKENNDKDNADIVLDITNIQEAPIVIRKYQDLKQLPYYLMFDNFQFFSGNIGDIKFYMGPRLVSERLAEEVTDTIAKGQKKQYFFDSTYPFTDSTDFMLLSLQIYSPFFDSLNSVKPFFKNGYGKGQIRHPFFVFQISDDLVFTDTTKAFLAKHHDIIQMRDSHKGRSGPFILPNTQIIFYNFN